MPEGPEVLTTALALNEFLQGATLLSVNVLGGKFEKTPPKGLSEMKFPVDVEQVTCKGKMLIFVMKGLMNMYAGLGMTGQFLYEQQKHSHLQLCFSRDGESFSLWFTDVRRFGNVSFSAEDLSAKLAPSIFGCKLNEFLERAKKVKTTKDVVSVLMDQSKVCSGIGNYMVAETLYQARIHPFCKFSSLSEDQLTRIYYAALSIAFDSFFSNGVSIKDFVSPDGKDGDGSKLLKVYGRTYDPLGNEVKKEIGGHDRTIWWVPAVQLE